MPDPASRAATAGFRGNAMCVFWKNSMETVEASTTCPDQPDFEREPMPRPNTLQSAHRADHRPFASSGRCDPAVVEHRLRSMMGEQHAR